MIDFSQAVQAISDNGGFKSNAQDTSFYRVYTTQGSKPIQVRVSNHGTHLWTWYDRNYNPSASINICIVLSQNGENNTNTSVDMRIKDEQGKVIGERKPFEVTQYVYNCQELNNNDAALINQAVLNIWRNGSFTDPLVNTPKKALVQRLQPTLKQNTENNQETNENKIMNKKQAIRLNESQFNNLVTKIVKESIKRVLKEGKSTNNINFQNQYRSGEIDWNELKRKNDEYGMFSDDVIDKQNQRKKNKFGDRLKWKEGEVNSRRGYTNPDGTERETRFTDIMKSEIMDYLQDYCDIWSWEDFKALPKEERNEIINSYYEYKNSGRLAKDKERKPSGSWINGEWWEGYVN